jgi:hypothetical protein
LESVKAALASGEGEHKTEMKNRSILRKAAGQTWEDPTLAEWPESMSYIRLLIIVECHVSCKCVAFSSVMFPNLN